MEKRDETLRLIATGGVCENEPNFFTFLLKNTHMERCFRTSIEIDNRLSINSGGSSQSRAGITVN